MDRDRLKHWGVALTPPILLPTARRLVRGRRSEVAPEWEYVPEGWSRRRDDLRGWNDPSVLEAYRTKFDRFRASLDGTGPLAYDSSAELDLGPPTVAEQNLALTFGHAVLLAALLQAKRGRMHLSVLDWGGGLGAYGFLARAVLPPDVELDYHCKEVPRIAAYGRDAVPEITFWDDERCLHRSYDLVVASSSLQYEEDWKATLGRLAAASNDVLLISRIQVMSAHPSFVVLQRAHGYRFETEYLGWVFNREELVATASASGFGLEREFVFDFSPDVVGAPARDEQWGYLFRRDRE